jgi:hypothetical protein
MANTCFSLLVMRSTKALFKVSVDSKTGLFVETAKSYGVKLACGDLRFAK